MPDDAGQPLSVVLAAGGTAGHIEPALNLADALRRRDDRTRITVIGSERGLETTLVPARGYDLVTVPAVPLPRRLNADLFALPARVKAATSRAAEVLREVEADVVVGFGGYAAVPGYLAARRTKVPLVIHEANAKPGIANRLGARFTSHVLVSVPGVMRGATTMSLPLRKDIATVDRSSMRGQSREFFGLDPQGPVLLVFGGSQGAQRLNAVLTEALPSILDSGVQVLHSYGARNDPPEARDGYLAVPYIDRMDLAYAAADLAVTRAGAMTCAELAAVGLPAIYVPLPVGNGEQRVNAEPVVQAGGGLLIEDADLSAEWLTRTVTSVMHDGGRLEAMASAARSHGVTNADEQMADIVVKVGRQA